MSKPIRIVHIGLGPLGRMLGPYLTEKDHLRVVGAVDVDPVKAGPEPGGPRTTWIVRLTWPWRDHWTPG